MIDTQMCEASIIRGMNITFALDEALVSAAKVAAAKQGKSITALVRTALEQQVALDQQVSSSDTSGVLQALVAYSLGTLPRHVVLDRLGIDDYGVLLTLLNEAHLPHPIVPLSTRNTMVAGMVQAIKAHQGQP